jgi:hypothetical protein
MHDMVWARVNQHVQCYHGKNPNFFWVASQHYKNPIFEINQGTSESKFKISQVICTL